MNEEKKFEKLYDSLINYERQMHDRNQKRIRIGLKCVVFIPPIFLILLFWTDSSKIIFLVLWIVSLFLISSYLISVEYADYQLQEKMMEWSDAGEERQIQALLGADLVQAEKKLKRVVKKVDAALNVEDEIEEKNVDVKQIETTKEAENEEHI